MSDLPLLQPGTDPAGDPEDDLVVFGDESAEPLAAPSRRRRWLLIGGLAVALVAVVAGLVGWRLLAKHTTLSAPDTVAGLRHDTNSDAAQTADYLREAIGAGASLKGTIGAVYNDPANADRSVLLFGGTGSISAPGSRLDSAFGLLDDQTGSVSGIHEVPAGPLGGVMKCGTSNGDGAPIAVCGWADGGSVALALFPDRSVDQAADLMRQLRAAVEHRG